MIVDTLSEGLPGYGLTLHAEQTLRTSLLDDAGGDRLDAVLALFQAAACARHGPPYFGLPPAMDALEGWIAGA
jgi:hypothetical protein